MLFMKNLMWDAVLLRDFSENIQVLVSSFAVPSSVANTFYNKYTK